MEKCDSNSNMRCSILNAYNQRLDASVCACVLSMFYSSSTIHVCCSILQSLTLNAIGIVVVCHTYVIRLYHCHLIAKTFAFDKTYSHLYYV